ncbi:MAG: hypothetical protein GY938_26955 [Ketobacter sp.]|nr:hypothetical protein [Ketobacter sp.]
MTKRILTITAILAIVTFAASFGFAAGGGSIRAFSHDYSVEADNAGDSPQIIVNGRGNDAVVTLAPLPTVEPRKGGGYVFWLGVFLMVALYSGHRVLNGKI